MSTPTFSPNPSVSPLPDGSPSTPVPSSTQTGGNGGGPSSSLYLFTFLATLFLLLFVSSAIILRSFVLRRRFRRRIEEAILAGVIAPNHTGRVRSRRTIGEKPKLWEARVTPSSDAGWDTIVPVSLLATSTLSKHTGSRSDAAPDGDPGNGSETQVAAAATTVTPPPLPTHTSNPPRSPNRRPWLHSPFSRRQRASSPLASPLPPTSQPTRSENPPSDTQTQNALPSSTYDRLQATVLIAMPDPRRPHPDGMVFSGMKGKERSLDLDYDEDDLPEMVLGLTELHYKDTITTPRTP